MKHFFNKLLVVSVLALAFTSRHCMGADKAHRLRRAVGGDVGAVDHQRRKLFEKNGLDVEVLY
jgi:hypothetical protein